MKFITVRDLRTSPVQISKALPEEQEMVITNTGKPIALLTPLIDQDIEDGVSAVRRARAATARKRIRDLSVRKGLPAMTMEEIEQGDRGVPEKQETMNVVLDTNVLISGLVNPEDTPAQVLNVLLNGRITVLYDSRILREYTEVLKRKKFGFDERLIPPLLDYLKNEGEYVVAEPIIGNRYVDRDDADIDPPAPPVAAYYPLDLSLPDLPHETSYPTALCGATWRLAGGQLQRFNRSHIKLVRPLDSRES